MTQEGFEDRGIETHRHKHVKHVRGQTLGGVSPYGGNY